MDDKFEEWINEYNRQPLKINPHSFAYRVAMAAWSAAIESTKENRFGCHYTPFNEPVYEFCLWDKPTNPVMECDSGFKSKNDCPYWREIKDK